MHAVDVGLGWLRYRKRGHYVAGLSGRVSGCAGAHVSRGIFRKRHAGTGRCASVHFSAQRESTVLMERLQVRASKGRRLTVKATESGF